MSGSYVIFLQKFTLLTLTFDLVTLNQYGFHVLTNSIENKKYEIISVID